MKESEAIKLPCPMMSTSIVIKRKIGSGGLDGDGVYESAIEVAVINCNGSKCPVWELLGHPADSGAGYCGLKGKK